MPTNKRTNQPKRHPRRWWFRKRVWLIGLAVITLVAAAFWVFTQVTSSNHLIFPADTGEPRAAIVDSLSINAPNPEFVKNATNLLQNAGYKVDLFQGEQITVDFYSRLPAAGYDFIVLRVHSGLLARSRAEGDMTIWLFTNEPYRRMGYYFSQIGDRVTAAKTSEDKDAIFAVSAKFFRGGTVGRFDNTIVVSLGCSSFYSDDMASAFCDIGAAAYLGWDASVGVRYVDKATLQLVGNLCEKKMTITEAVDDIMDEIGPEPNTRALLKYYPLTSANLTIADSIK